MMKNTIRCCISCILPCGALDVIRIVHSNGHVEEISGNITASEIMKAYPKHILKKPSSSQSVSDDSGVIPRIVIVPPDAELQRGKIYFLMPAPPSVNKDKTRSTKPATTAKSTGGKKKRENHNHHPHHHNQHRRSNNSGNAGGCIGNSTGNTDVSEATLLVSDRYLSEILSEKVSTQRDRRRGRVGVWRPHLESISESINDG